MLFSIYFKSCRGHLDLSETVKCFHGKQDEELKISQNYEEGSMLRKGTKPKWIGRWPPKRKEKRKEKKMLSTDQTRKRIYKKGRRRR